MTERVPRTSVATRVRHLVPEPLRRRAARFVAGRRAAETERHLARLASDPRPIVLGPWVGEVGFELLYWVPFVRWFAERFDVAPDRLIAVSRGGAATWYSAFADGSYDALAFMTPDEFRRKNQARAGDLGEQKQIEPGRLEQELISLIREAAGRDLAVLHPSVMYRLFAPYWWGHAPIDWVRQYTRHELLPAVPLDPPSAAAYTAVKFYFNDCFTDTSAHRAFVTQTVSRLSRQGAVISLSTGICVDDHAPCEPEVPAVPGIQNYVTPESNLRVQSAVVSNAVRFVGTYGGFAYLAPLFGVPAVAYHAGPGAFSMRHLDVIRDVLRSQGRPELLEVSDIEGSPVRGMITDGW